MTYLLKVLHADHNNHVVFQTTYADLALASQHVTDVAAKYPPGFTVKLYDGGGTEIQSEDGNKAGVRYDRASKEMLPDESR